MKVLFEVELSEVRGAHHSQCGSQRQTVDWSLQQLKHTDAERKTDISEP